MFAQEDVKNWQWRDHDKDSFYGISLNETYQFLHNKKSKPIIVAVIDSGIDTLHEDLKNILWHNPKEIPGNGIDDDGNGYIDDVYGWNFLGNINGNNLTKDIDERTRVYYKFRNKFSGKSVDEDTLTDLEKEQYRTWQKAASNMKPDNQDDADLMKLTIFMKMLKKNSKILQAEIKKDTFTVADVEALRTETNGGKQSKLAYLTFMKMADVESGTTNIELLSEMEEEVNGKQENVDSKFTAPPDYRKQVINDNYYDINDRYYGNNDVMGTDPMHGTHVSGLIAAQRGNELGIDGIADNVKIMMVRAVPQGDEYDKDIALAIKYAVDNGAKVINMSFGKGYSPEKKWVDEAVKYAESKDVLLVHAAGNESEDIDTTDNYPNPELVTFNSHANNFITVGASSDTHFGKGEMIAGFSNYGAKEVDVFAPGVKIYSTMPGGNNYGFLQGTSFSSPIVAGVAALLRSYYPELSAKQIKYVIEQSSTHFDSTLVNEPGTNTVVPMSALCASGGFLNAYAAVQLAATLKPEVQKEKKQEAPKVTFRNTPAKQ